MTFGFSMADIPPPTEMAPVEWDFAREMASSQPESVLEKYWGKISVLETCSDGSVWKLIEMNPWSQSSLEYHVTKRETYFLMHGELEIGIRIGRAVNRVLTMRTGQQFVIPPGLMHMRIARQKALILEWASHDDPKDSHIVEDGWHYNHLTEES